MVDANGRMVMASRDETPDAWTVYDALGNRVASKINDVWNFAIYDAFGKLVAEYGEAAEGFGGVKFVQQDWQCKSVPGLQNCNFLTEFRGYGVDAEDARFDPVFRGDIFNIELIRNAS